MSSLGSPTHPTINGLVQPFCEKPECMMPFLAVSSPIPERITVLLKEGIAPAMPSFRNLQSAICNLQSAICNLQSAICNLQSAICNLQSAICNLQSAICSSA
jgi:hypothetical protein